MFHKKCYFRIKIILYDYMLKVSLPSKEKGWPLTKGIEEKFSAVKMAFAISGSAAVTIAFQSSYISLFHLNFWILLNIAGGSFLQKCRLSKDWPFNISGIASSSDCKSKLGRSHPRMGKTITILHWVDIIHSSRHPFSKVASYIFTKE